MKKFSLIIFILIININIVLAEPFNNSFQYPIKNPDFENSSLWENWSTYNVSSNFYFVSSNIQKNGSKAVGLYAKTNVPAGERAYLNQTGVNFNILNSLTFWYQETHAAAGSELMAVKFKEITMISNLTSPSVWANYTIINNQSGIGNISFVFRNTYNGGWGETQVFHLDNLTGQYNTITIIQSSRINSYQWIRG